MSVHFLDQVIILPYEHQYKKAFRDINYAWISKYFEVTTLDKQAFDNPKKEILDKGGYIFLAKISDHIIGSVALERVTSKQFAITRMGVDINYQGKKIGQLLMGTAIAKSKELKLDSIILYTNQLLINALNLYIKNGFNVVPLDSVSYKRATIKMELKLTD